MKDVCTAIGAIAIGGVIGLVIGNGLIHTVKGLIWLIRLWWRAV